MRQKRLPFLGVLEREVMEHLWAKGPRDAKTVHGVVGRSRGITLNTVQSTLKRLYKKGLLTREKVSHAHVYSARLSQEAFQQQLLADVMVRLTRGDEDAMLSAIVDLTERVGEEQLQKLEKMIAARRKARKKERP